MIVIVETICELDCGTGLVITSSRSWHVQEKTFEALFRRKFRREMNYQRHASERGVLLIVTGTFHLYELRISTLSIEFQSEFVVGFSENAENCFQFTLQGCGSHSEFVSRGYQKKLFFHRKYLVPKRSLLLKLMFVLLVLSSSYDLPNKAHDIRSGIFRWANALSGQRLFLKGQRITISGTELHFDNKDIDMHAVGRNLIPSMIGINLSQVIQDLLNSVVDGSTNSDKTAETTSSHLLSGQLAPTGCSSLPPRTIEYSFCRNLYLDNYVDDQYWGMSMGEFVASMLGYVAVIILLVVFFVVSIVFYCIFCVGCCCCCRPHRHSLPGICNLITMILSCTLIIISAIFYMCGWLGVAKVMSLYKNLDGEDGVAIAVLNGLDNTLTKSFDTTAGFPSVLLPVVQTTRDTLESDVTALGEVVQDVLDVGVAIQNEFNDIYSSIGPNGEEGKIIALVQENNRIAREESQGHIEEINTDAIVSQMNDIKEKLDSMTDQLDTLNQVNEIPAMINNSLSPALNQAEDFLQNPLGSLLGTQNLSKLLDDLRNNITSETGILSEIAQYDTVAQSLYKSITGLYMIFGVLLLGITAIWITAFWTYSCCSRCVVNCSCCCPCCCTWCCLFTGLVGTVGCVVVFYVLTWSVDLGDGAIQGIYSSAFGDEIVIPDIDLTNFSNGLIKEPLHIEPIKMGNADDLTIFDNILTADASTVKDIVSWLSLEEILPLSTLANNVKTGVSNLLS